MAANAGKCDSFSLLGNIKYFEQVGKQDQASLGNSSVKVVRADTRRGDFQLVHKVDQHRQIVHLLRRHFGILRKTTCWLATSRLQRLQQDNTILQLTATLA